jgi:UDP-N-acetylmuramate dehydrogenase
MAGIENLSWIPGDVGAAPVQNIGAYGVEFKDVFVKAEGVYIKSGEPFSIDNDACAFGYRDSIFKNELKNKVVITSVYIQIDQSPPGFCWITAMCGKLWKCWVNQHSGMCGNASSDIRRQKLPDPEVFGNAGSFFKNPMVDVSVLDPLSRLIFRRSLSIPCLKVPW